MRLFFQGGQNQLAALAAGGKRESFWQQMFRKMHPDFFLGNRLYDSRSVFIVINCDARRKRMLRQPDFAEKTGGLRIVT